MAKRLLLVLPAVLALVSVSLGGQSKPTIQGVWRAVEITVTNPNPPPGTPGTGTHTSVQPELLIFTGKHYSRVADLAGQPRPTTPFKVQGKPTLEELQARWGPFQAHAGTYEISGNTLTRRMLVAKSTTDQSKQYAFSDTIKLDGNNLWLTETERPGAVKRPYPDTIKYVRVE